MRKITSIFAACMVTAMMVAQNPVVTTEWELSAATTSLPTYIGTANSVRGMGVGTFESEKVVVVPSREGGVNVRVLKASDGSEWKSLNVTGITGGLFVVSDAGVTADGKILVSNMSNSNNNPSHPFKVYRWDNSTDAPTVAISYVLPGAYRFGDHMTVKGSISDGSAKVYVVSGTLVNTIAEVWRFDMVSDGNGGFVFNNTPTNISTGITAIGGYPSVDFLPNGMFLNKYNGSQIRKYNADGTYVTGQETSSAVVATGGNSVRYFRTFADSVYLAYFRYGAGQERANILKTVNGDLTSTAVVASTPTLGPNANSNGAGRVALEITGGQDDYIYVFSTNNGLGKYKISWPADYFLSTVKTSDKVRLINADGRILVEGAEVSSIELYNTVGQKVKSVNGVNELSTSGLNGVYIVQVKSQDRVVKTAKISVR